MHFSSHFFWPEKWTLPFFPHLEVSLGGLDGDLLGDTGGENGFVFFFNSLIVIAMMRIETV